jgi:hypothetical protein
LQVTPTNWALPVKGAQEQANRIQCYTESDGPDYLKANWSLPRPIGLNTSFGYQPDSHVGKKTALFEPFIYKNQHFAKTGSGQT